MTTQTPKSLSSSDPRRGSKQHFTPPTLMENYVVIIRVVEVRT